MLATSVVNWWKRVWVHRKPLQFASQVRVAPHAELVDEFLLRVIGVEAGWVSDESSLWDFHSEETNEKYYTRIREIYGVDVSDVESANIAEILDRIAKARVVN